ncbi:MAG: AsmA-like C-terminal region-containing protein [Rufibacter sp.]
MITPAPKERAQLVLSYFCKNLVTWLRSVRKKFVLKRKKIAKYFFFAVGGIALVLAVAVGAIYLYQDKIIQLFVTEANKHIKTKVAVEQIEVTLWEKFPAVAINLHNVEITEAVPGSSAPLAKLANIYSTFHLWDLLRGTYHIREIYLEEGEVQIKVLPNGEVNYKFYQDADTSHTGNLSFNLENIVLANVQVQYHDAPGQQKYQLQARALSAALSIEEAKVAIQAKGKAVVQALHIGESEFLKQKEISLSSQLTIDTKQNIIAIAPSELQVEKAVYQIGGEVMFQEKKNLDLFIQGKNTDVQSLLALLPPRYTKQLARYRSQGDVYFSGSVKGEASAKKNPFIDITFGAKGASFYHPEYKEKVERVNLEGRFTNGQQRNSATSVLELRKITGNLRGKPFSGEVVYRNFLNPDLQANLKATIDVAHVLGIFPVEDIRKGSGQAQVQFSFAGNLKIFKANPGSASIKTSGEVNLKGVNLQFRQHPSALTNLNGTFLFRRNDVAVTDFKGKVGDSDFLLNGYFKNVLAWLFLKNQRLRVEADFVSRTINMDQLLAASAPGGNTGHSTGKAGDGAAYTFHMPANLELDLNASVGNLRFRRFKAKQLQGQVRLQNQVITSPNISLRAAGGRFKVHGSVDARQKLIRVNSVANLENIRVDSLMYVFEDFGQKFITQRHLQGDLTAHIDSELFFDHTLSPRTDLMQAEIKTSIRNGQLLSFEPLQKMSTFIERRELANLKFSELKNNFWIQERTIYIPEMEIKSSTSRFSNITISGTHTFDQQMDYHLRIPLASAQPKRDKDERFGTVAGGSSPSPNLFLIIKGKEGNYKVAYDQEKVKDKIATDLQKEKQELKDVFKGKKKEEKAVKPAEEYFEF